MQELASFLPAYMSRDYCIVIQGILFALANDAFFFRRLPGRNRMLRGILSFLVSFSTVNFLAAFSYTHIAPQFTTPMGDEKLLEYEALARWDDPSYGLLTPWQFIEPLEKANLVYKVDTFILAQYGRERQECIKRNEHLAPISFNLSRTDFYSCDIYGIVKSTMEQYQIPPDCLHVEITESAVIQNLDQLKDAICKFHALGLEVWMFRICIFPSRREWSS